LRNLEDGDRATLEYKIYKTESIHVERVQSLGKYNSRLDESWNDVLKVLDGTVIKAFSDERFESVKIKKKCSNGVELFSDSEFSTDGYLGWKFKTIINEFGLYI
jgi:hypothetical protein